MKDKSRIIFGNVMSPKDYKAALKSKEKYIRKFGDDSATSQGTGKSGSYGMWNHPRGHVWNVFVRPASS